MSRALLESADLSARAVSRSYFAAVYAAEAALLQPAETRSKHSGVIAAFIRVVVRDGAGDERVGRLLRDLYERRGQAGSSTDPVPPAEGDRSISDAATVVALIEAWIDSRA